MKEQLRIGLSKDAAEALRAAAAKKGITPGILARLILYEHIGQTDAESKSYTFITKKWREFEEYAEAKCLGNVGVFACFAMDRYMSQNALTKGRRQQSEEL